nr:MAG TPA: YopX protein [Bacteriophage sp.]
MENRYLFRAKRIDNGEWVEGNLIQNSDAEDGWEAIIIPTKNSNMFTKHIKHGYGDLGYENWYRVDPSTICQCTGLKDKNGKLIWENDIVSFEDTGEEGYEYKEGFDFVNKAKVEFAEGRWSLTDFVSDNSGVMDEMYDHAEFMEFWQYCEVIGNVFDNPELLEV